MKNIKLILYLMINFILLYLNLPIIPKSIKPDDEIINDNINFLKKMDIESLLFVQQENRSNFISYLYYGKEYKSDNKLVEIELFESDDDIINFVLSNSDKSEIEVPEMIQKLNLNPAVRYKFVNNQNRIRIAKCERFKYNDILKQNQRSYYSFRELLEYSKFEFQLNYFDNDVRSITIKFRGKYKIMGLGERFQKLFYEDGVYTLKSMGYPSPNEDGIPPGKSMYGVHPVLYLVQTDNHYRVKTLFLNNVSPQDWYIDTSQGNLELKIIATGNVMDFYYFESDNLDDAVKKYHLIIGNPLLPPIQALGWNQSKYGYKDLNMNWNVIRNYEKYKLPLDVFWNDIDLMDHYYNFTLDPYNFNVDKFKKFRSELKSKGIGFVPIIDAGIAINSNYEVYITGKEFDLYIKSKYTNEDLKGIVWPGQVSFPDFYNPYTTDWWIVWLNHFHSIVEFSGVWIDMNESYNYCMGEYPNNCQTPSEVELAFYELSFESGEYFDFFPSKDEYTDYIPGGMDPMKNVISPSAYHFDINLDKHNPEMKEMQLHSTFGYMEGRATNKWFTDHNLRPFIISRSTAFGSGKFNSHWLGDNFSIWENLQMSIPGVLNFNMFGIPLVGPDVCGFKGNTTYELCYRWTQLAAWYPFSRNHSDVGTERQEPYYFNEHFRNMFKQSIYTKYTYIYYWYSLMTKVSIEGGMVVKPAFSKYPDYVKLYDYSDSTFMIGDSIFVAPVLNQNYNIEFYLPPSEKWFNPSNNSIVFGYIEYEVKTKGDIEEKGTLLDIPYFIRIGSALPTVDIHHEEYINLSNVQTRPLTLSLYPDYNYDCYGYVYLDDGIVYDQTISMYEIVCRKDEDGIEVEMKCISNDECVHKKYVKSIQLFDLKQEVWKYFDIDLQSDDWVIKLNLDNFE